MIAAAADRQMAHLRTYQSGPHAALSQQLLNEVAAARICLLNADKKAAYDARLREALCGAGVSPAKAAVIHEGSPDGGGSSAQKTVEWTGLRQLGEYRLLEKLGAGGMGEVYKAVHTEMDRVVALKVLPAGLLRDEHAVARFKREIKAVAQLDHPNIVRPHDAREVEGLRFLVMEYVQGLDLRDVAHRLGPLSVPDACELVRQAALGLQWPASQWDKANVWIDDQPQDPATLASVGDVVRVSVAPGKHTVSVVPQGHEPFEATVTVEAGKDSVVRVTRSKPPPPPPAKQFLVIEWRSGERGPGAELKIDGQPRTPAEVVDPKNPDQLRVEVASGEHKVFASRPGFNPCEKSEKVEPGKDAVVQLAWERVPPPIDPAIAAREERWRMAIKPVDDLASAWDFLGAQAQLAKVHFEEPELQARLARRADELKRMAALKAKIIARVNAGAGTLQKRDLMLRGGPGEVTGADEAAIHAQLSGGKSEDHPWAKLNETARPAVLQMGIDEKSVDDSLAAGLMDLAARDVPLAETHFDKARSLGTDIGPYLAPLAAAEFDEAQRLAEKKDYKQALETLARVEDKYGRTPWYGANKAAVERLRSDAQAGIREAEAEKLFAEGVELYNKKELFDLKPIVEKLKADYAGTRPLTDAARKPSFADLEMAVPKGKRFTVARLGKDSHGQKTDFTTIQAAIDAAPNDSLIEIMDNGPYNERIVILKEKEGLSVRGKKGCWPVLTFDQPAESLFVVFGSRTTLDRLVIIHSKPIAGTSAEALALNGSCYARNLLAGAREQDPALVSVSADAQFTECVILGSVGGKYGGQWRMHNCVVTGNMTSGGRDPLRFCVIMNVSPFNQGSSDAVDCIVGRFGATGEKQHIENCATILEAPPHGSKNCFRADPQFLDPTNLDYRLSDKSPCRGKASDGGDLGFRYTPEIVEVLKKAFELRAKGIIKF